jgi:hypothetical protein
MFRLISSGGIYAECPYWPGRLVQCGQRIHAYPTAHAVTQSQQVSVQNRTIQTGHAIQQEIPLVAAILEKVVCVLAIKPQKAAM